MQEDGRSKVTKSKKTGKTHSRGYKIGVWRGESGVSCPLLKRLKLKRKTTKDRRPDNIMLAGCFQSGGVLGKGQRVLRRMFAMSCNKRKMYF